MAKKEFLTKIENILYAVKIVGKTWIKERTKRGDVHVLSKHEKNLRFPSQKRQVWGNGIFLDKIYAKLPLEIYNNS